MMLRCRASPVPPFEMNRALRWQSHLTKLHSTARSPQRLRTVRRHETYRRRNSQHEAIDIARGVLVLPISTNKEA